MKNFQVIQILLSVCVLFLLGLCAQAQNPFASTGAMDTMNEAPVAGGLGTTSYIDRAREVGIAPRPSTATAPAGDPTLLGIEAEGGSKGGRAGRMPVRGEFGPDPNQPQATPAPTPKMIRVLTGSRVECAVSGILLEDIVYKDVPEAQKGEYYDDGTHGDIEAGDGTYTNITVRKDVMSPESHAVLARTLKLLEKVESMEPMDFYRLSIVTSDPLSALPKQIDEEQNRDMMLSSWDFDGGKYDFLGRFRTKVDDPKSAFYPLYVPPPPSYPNTRLPEGFKPVVAATATPSGGQGGPGFTMDAMMNDPTLSKGGRPGQGSYYRSGKSGRGGGGAEF